MTNSSSSTRVWGLMLQITECRRRPMRRSRPTLTSSSTTLVAIPTRKLKMNSPLRVRKTEQKKASVALGSCTMLPGSSIWRKDHQRKVQNWAGSSTLPRLKW